MSKSVIADIIANHRLRTGDAMRDVHGGTIPESIVLNSHTVIYREDDHFVLLHERPIVGGETRQTLSVKAVRALQAIPLPPKHEPFSDPALYEAVPFTGELSLVESDGFFDDALLVLDPDFVMGVPMSQLPARVMVGAETVAVLTRSSEMPSRRFALSRVPKPGASRLHAVEGMTCRVEAAVGKGDDFTYDRLTVTDQVKDRNLINVV